MSRASASARPNEVSERRSAAKITRRPGDSPFIDIEAISDTRNYSFRTELKKAAEGLQKVQCRQFMTAVGIHFGDSRIRPPEMVAVLEALQQILQRKCHAQMFVELELHKALPLQANDAVLNAALDVLLVLFEKRPELFETGFEEHMDQIIAKRPQKAIILLMAFAKAFGDLTNGWTLLDLLFQKRKAFFKASCGAELVSILYWLNQTFPEFRQARGDNVLAVLRMGLSSSDTRSIPLCYSGLAQFYEADLDRDLEYGLVVSHLGDETLCPNCLNLLLKVRDLPALPELVHALVNCAKSRVEAALCLLRIVALEEGAAILLRKPAWIAQGTPTVIDTLRLYLAIMTHMNLRPVLSRLKQTDSFLLNLCRESDSRVFKYIAMILKKLELDEEIVQRMSDCGLLKELFKSLLEFDDIHATEASLAILQRLARIGFWPDCLRMAPMLRDLIEADDKLTRSAMVAATHMSKYPLCAKTFRDLKMDRLFKRFSRDRDYREIVQTFLENMSVAEFY
jgi:hypothetical protein